MKTTMGANAQNIVNLGMTVLVITHAMRMETKFVCLDGVGIAVKKVGHRLLIQ